MEMIDVAGLELDGILWYRRKTFDERREEERKRRE